jgi:hypothetical protein
MDSKGRPTTPDVPAAPPAAGIDAKEYGLETKFRAELDFGLQKQSLAIRSRCSTIMLEAIILEAVARIDRAEWKTTTLPEDGIVRVAIDYDMETDEMELSGSAPRVLIKGVLAHALGAVTRNQTAQNFAVYKTDMEKRVKSLEERAGVKKIILPGG